jgi:UDP-N-acetyl-2-amino-2-deoxyglucuronate dehydrogenase
MIGFAVVGLGMGRSRARQIQRQTEGAVLRLVVDLKEDLAREVGEELGCDWSPRLEDALGRDDVDVVMVMTPSGLHAEVGIQAARAGKHVLTTKPMDVTTAACDRLIEAAQTAGVILGVDYQSRYVDGNVQVAEAVRQGWLGSPILGEVRFKWFRSQEYFEHNGGWRGTWAMDGGGSLANQGSHLLDLLLWYMGDPVRLYATTAIRAHQIETEDIGLAILEYPNGAKGTVLGTTTFPTSVYFAAEVHGTEGAVLIDAALDGTMRVFGPGLQEKLATVGNDVHSAMEDMVRAITQGTPVRVSGHEGRRTVALLEHLYRSARERTPVDVCIAPR